MPNPELSQYKDNDTNITYDLKDAAARTDLSNFKDDIRKSIIMIATMGTGSSPGYTHWNFGTPMNDGVFVGQDQAFVRIHFNSGLADYTKPVRFIYYFDETHGSGVYICNVVTNYKTMQNLAGHYKQGDVLDFIFYKYTYTFVLVGPSDSADLSNYYTKTETDTLLNAKVSDNPTFTEATTRANIASGETFAVILGKIKKFFADLKTVAFTGSYNDLTNTPTIPAAQIQSDWTQADNTAVDYIKNKPTLAAVATSGSYNDLTDQPTIPDISTKMDKSNPTGTGKLSINRLYNSTEGTDSVAVGNDTTASGIYSHAEGNVTVASGSSSHAEGTETTASGNNGSHAEGQQTEAAGRSSHAEGNNTIAASDYQHVSGKFNVADNADTYAEIIGNGKADNSRSNARTLDWSGNETIAGDLYFNGSNTALSSQLSAKADSSSLATVATTGDYADLLNKPTIPAAQVNSDWNANSGVAEILNKPSLATVATSGNYNDLTNKLSAGTNISISASNEISATDTKPRDGQFDNTPTAVSVPNSTDWSCIAPDDPICTAPAGSVWIVSVALQYPSNTSGFRSIAISTTNTGSTAPAAIMQQTVAPANGAATNLIFTTFVAPTTATTYYIWGRQNSGAARNVTYRYRAIRIL